MAYSDEFDDIKIKITEDEQSDDSEKLSSDFSDVTEETDLESDNDLDDVTIKIKTNETMPEDSKSLESDDISQNENINVSDIEAFNLDDSKSNIDDKQEELEESNETSKTDEAKETDRTPEASEIEKTKDLNETPEASKNLKTEVSDTQQEDLVNTQADVKKKIVSMDDKKIAKLSLESYDDASSALDSYESRINYKEDNTFETNTHKYTIINQISDLDEVKFFKVKNETDEIFLLKLFKKSPDIITRTSYLNLLTNVPSNINLSPIIDSGFFKDFPFDILPLYENISLDKLEINIYDLKIILKDINDALNYLHSNKYVHLNISLETIFYDVTLKKAYLGDFITKNHSNGVPISKKYGYVALELLQNNITFSADYYALGITIASAIMGKYPFKDMSTTEIYKSIFDKKFVQKLENEDLKNLIIGLTLQDYKKRYSSQEICDFLDGKRIKDIREINQSFGDFKGAIIFNDIPYKSKYDFGMGLFNNWEESAKSVKSGDLFLVLKRIDNNFAGRYKEIAETSKTSDEMLSKILTSFDLGKFILYKSKVINSLQDLANQITSKLPCVDDELLEIFTSGVLSDSLKYAYEKTGNNEYLECLNMIAIYQTNPNILYYLISFKYATTKAKIVFDRKDINDYTDLITIIASSNNAIMAYKRLMNNDLLFAYLSLICDLDTLVSIKNDLVTDTVHSYYNFLNILVNKGYDIKSLLDKEFSAWVVNNYKKYKYIGKEASKVKKELASIYNSQVTNVFEFVNNRHNVVNQFLSLFQDDTYFDYNQPGIKAKKLDYYPIIPYENEICTPLFIKNNNNEIDTVEMFYDTTKSNTTNVLNKTKEDLSEAYELYYNHYASLSKKASYIKTQKIIKTFKIGLIVSIILEAIYQALYYIPYTKDFINKKFSLVIDNYIPITVMLALTLIINIFLLIPVRSKLSRIKRYRNAVVGLVSTQKYVEAFLDSLSKEKSIGTLKAFKKNKKSNIRISYSKVHTNANKQIENCSKYRLKKESNKYIIKWSERLYTAIHHGAITVALLFILTPILNKTSSLDIIVSSTDYYLIGFCIPFISLILTFIMPKRPNISRFYYYFSLILSVALAFVYFIVIK